MHMNILGHPREIFMGWGRRLEADTGLSICCHAAYPRLKKRFEVSLQLGIRIDSKALL